MNLLDKGTKRLKRGLHHRFNDARFLLTGKVPLEVQKARGTVVLVYHGVVPSDPFRFNSRFISTARFEQHLVLLRKYFHLLTFQDFEKGFVSTDRLNVLITFDDGYRNNYDNAFPVLRKHKIPAVFFICRPAGATWLFNDVIDLFSGLGPRTVTINDVKFVKGGRLSRYTRQDGTSMQHHFQNLGYDGRLKVMDEVFSKVPTEVFKSHGEYIELLNDWQIKQIAETPGYAVGSHTLSHVDLGSSERRTAYTELAESRKKIGQITGTDITALAFPYGRYNADILNICRETGYRFCFGTEFQPAGGASDSVIPRFTINPFISAVNELCCISLRSHD